jgi:hypothetical protein
MFIICLLGSVHKALYGIMSVSKHENVNLKGGGATHKNLCPDLGGLLT